MSATIEWWFNSRNGSVVHALRVDDPYPQPLCGRVVIYSDGWQPCHTDPPHCKWCSAALADHVLPEGDETP